MKTNKNHWYDGWFYDSIIAPNQDSLFAQIKSLIERNSKIIDVGCGTGRFSFSIADNCKSILGIDLSIRNINRANLKLRSMPNSKITFQHTSLSEIINEGKEQFDYAIITYVIHEVDEEERINLLKDISLIADKIIIGDYLVPKPNGFWSAINEAVEFAAGSDHYINYKNFVATGGIYNLIEKAELKIITEVKNQPYTSHLIMLSK